MAEYLYRGQKVPLKITYGLACGRLDELGLDILSLFEDDNQVIPTIMLNDKVMLRVRFYFLQEAGVEDDWENSISDMTPQEMQNFKEAFWDEVVNFSPPPAREALRQFWVETKKRLKSQKALSSSMSSDLPDEQG